MSETSTRCLGYRQFGDWLRGIREQKGWTQQQVADKIGLGLQQYHRIENGLARSKVETIESIAEVLSLPRDETMLRWLGITDRVIDLSPVMAHFYALPLMARDMVTEQIEGAYRRYVVEDGDQSTKSHILARTVGQQMLDEWEADEVLGLFSDRPDSPEFAAELRKRGEERG